MASTDQINYPGDYSLNEVILIPYTEDGYEQPVDLSELTHEINLYESIYSDSLSGEIVLNDASGFTDFTDFRTNLVYVHIATPGVSHEIQHLFYVYHIESIEAKDRQNAVMLHFVSLEHMKNRVVRVERSFTPTKVSGNPRTVPEMVVALLNEDPPKGLGINGDEYANTPGDISIPQKTVHFNNQIENQINFTSPKWHPFRCVNHLIERSYSESGSPSFMFFERTDGFWAMNLYDGFVGAQDNLNILRSYAYHPARLSGYEPGEDISHKYEQIMNLRRKSDEEEISDRASGARASKVAHMDFLTKRYKEYGFDSLTQTLQQAYPHETLNSIQWRRQQKDLRQTKPLKEPYGISPYRGKPDVFRFSDWEREDQRLMMEPTTTSFYYTDGARLARGSEQDISQWLQPRIQFLAELEMYSYQIAALGRVDYHAGDYVKLFLPSTRTITDDSKSAESTIDEKRSGVYLVTNIRHQFTKSRHLVHFDVARDALSSKRHFPIEQ